MPTKRVPLHTPKYPVLFDIQAFDVNAMSDVNTASDENTVNTIKTVNIMSGKALAAGSLFVSSLQQLAPVANELR